jgi:hypothetical protein
VQLHFLRRGMARRERRHLAAIVYPEIAMVFACFGGRLAVAEMSLNLSEALQSAHTYSLGSHMWDSVREGPQK